MRVASVAGVCRPAGGYAVADAQCRYPVRNARAEQLPDNGDAINIESEWFSSHEQRMASGPSD